MSRHYYVQVNNVENIYHDFKTLDKYDFEDLYGVELLEDGGVFDPILNKTFDTFNDWVDAQASEGEYSENEISHHSSKKYMDEEGC